MRVIGLAIAGLLAAAAIAEARSIRGSILPNRIMGTAAAETVDAGPGL